MMKYEHAHIRDGGNTVDEAMWRMRSLHGTSTVAAAAAVTQTVLKTTMSRTNTLLSKHFYSQSFLSVLQ
jgi:hypothetical protein